MTEYNNGSEFDGLNNLGMRLINNRFIYNDIIRFSIEDHIPKLIIIYFNVPLIKLGHLILERQMPRISIHTSYTTIITTIHAKGTLFYFTSLTEITGVKQIYTTRLGESDLCQVN